MNSPRKLESAIAIALIGALIALVGCAAQPGSGSGEFDEDPRKGLPHEQAVDVMVEGLGLDGYVAHDNPTVIDYLLRNRGPARRVTLELHEWPRPKNVPLSSTIAANTSPLEVELGPGEENTGRWIMPPLMMRGQGDSELLVLARGKNGGVLGASVVPKVKQTYGLVAVIAADADTGLAIQEAIHRADLGQGVYAERHDAALLLHRLSQGATAGRHEVALLLGDPPDLWYEFGPAITVILARPWSDLPADSRLALRRHVAFGGTLHVLPEHCPDWRTADPAGQADPGLLPFRYGAGNVFVEPATSGERESWLARTIPGRGHAGRGHAGTGWNAVNPPLTLAYVMPDASLLVALILLIVVLLGPGTHLMLVQLGRREWLWVAIPALSVVLAGCMYAVVASGIKGEASALEVHYLVQSFGDAPDAAVSTAIRVQSAKAGPRSVRVSGEQPRALFASFAPLGTNQDRRKTLVTEDRVAIRDIPMHRFSSHDLGMTFPGKRRKVRVEAIGQDGVRVVNNTGAALTDLYLERSTGWVWLAKRIEPGQTLERRSLGLGTSRHELLEDFPNTHLIRVLDAAFTRRNTAAVNDYVLVAGCSPHGLPEVVMSPAPSVTRVRASCAWLVTPPERATAGSAP